MSAQAKFLKAEVENSNGEWRVNTWLVNGEGKQFCNSVHTLPNRRLAREYRDEQQLKFSDPSFYQGANI